MSCLFCSAKHCEQSDIHISLILCHTIRFVCHVFFSGRHAYGNISLIHTATTTIQSSFGKELENSLLFKPFCNGIEFLRI